ncbi:DgyrCDS8408 [Dimorphilus gyrociliatus]|uniref:DgyrCDS8408 n=1 Tax=Dimorphilus gyrociliatus TaxID=2664684 RepID=A0A7I8VVR8_9ANNE|nr:DgyrCDS8408 [Dimorphilus gyrociliatus]
MATSRATATISGSTEKHDNSNKKYTVYTITVNFGNKRWAIYRRYNEFQTIYEKLKKLKTDVSLKLPGRKFIGNHDEKVLKARREGLNELLQKIMSHPLLSQRQEVKDFLNITENESDESSFEEKSNGSVDLGPSEKRSVKPSDFEFLRVIGKGSFGKVMMAKHKQEDRIYAVKVLQKQHIIKRNEVKHIMSERNVLVKNVRHPFLVGLHYSFQSIDKLYFVLDYVNGGELFYHLQRERRFPESRAKFYAAEIASALGYLHSLNIIYRDLKPENLLLDSEGHVVLTDFGLCKEDIEKAGTTSTFCGTPEYLAPEVLKKKPYDRMVDWWCLGGVLYEMLFGLPPFYSTNVDEMYRNILQKPLRFPNSASKDSINILTGMLQKDKSKRLGHENDFLDIRKHAFFAPINWEKLDQRAITPPYNPNVGGDLDLRHISGEFTSEPITSSVKTGGNPGMTDGAGGQTDQNAFSGFTYDPRNEIPQ